MFTAAKERTFNPYGNRTVVINELTLIIIYFHSYYKIDEVNQFNHNLYFSIDDNIIFGIYGKNLMVTSLTLHVLSYKIFLI